MQARRNRSSWTLVRTLAAMCCGLSVAALEIGQAQPSPVEAAPTETPAVETPAVEPPALEPPTESAAPPVVYTVIDETLRARDLENATLYGRVTYPPEPGNTVEIALWGGAQAWSLGDLNAVLERNGYEPAPDVVGTFGFLIGGGNRDFHGTFLFGGAGANVPSRDGTIDARVSCITLQGQAGYYLYRDTVLGVYPLVGVGVGVVNVRAQTTDPDRIPILRGQITEIENGFEAWSPQLALELGLGAQTVIPMFSESGEYGLSVIVQAGYALSALHADWSTDKDDAGYKGPSANVGGPFVRLALGWGYSATNERVIEERVPECHGEECRLDCRPGFASCDYDPRNGCETPIGTDSNCSACGDSCDLAHAQGMCMAGACAVQTCAPSFADCNANPEDGCEADVRVQPNHCGACGNACAEGVSCVSGRCANPEAAPR